MSSYQPALLPSRHAQRRLSGRQWPQDVPSPRRRSPSPGSSRRYDSYVPPRAGPLRRDDYPNVYRPNNWRPNFSPSRSPSPDRYDHHTAYDSDSRDRSPAWPTFTSISRSGRRSPPLPLTPPKDRNRRDTMATPMFEPSDTWKQSHNEPRLGRNESLSPIADRFLDRRMRRSRERSLERSSLRGPYPPSIPGGDRYRPHEPGYSLREPFRVQRVADCYRPKYDAETRPRDRGSSTERSRKDSAPGTVSDRSPRGSGGKWSSRGLTPPRSPSPSRRPRSPRASPPRSVFSTEADVRLASGVKSRHDTATDGGRVEAPAQQYPDHNIPERPQSRPPSRSSIASSRPSDRYSQPSSPHASTFPPAVVVDRMASVDLQAQFAGSSTLEDKKEDASPRSSPSQPPRHDFPVSSLAEPQATEGIPINIPQSLPDARILENLDVPKSETSRSRSITPMEVETTSQASTIKHEAQTSSSSPLTYPLEYMDDSQKTLFINARRPSSDGEASASKSKESVRTDVNETATEEHTPEKSTSIIDAIATNATRRVEDQFTERTVVSSVKGKGREVDFTISDIPLMADAKSLTDALRVVVMTRLLYDRQTREERVEPVLMTNLAHATSHTARFASTTERQCTPDTRDSPVTVSDSSFPESLESVSGSTVRRTLAARFSAREAARDIKIRHLRAEYLSLHERWVSHCTRLDSVMKANPAEEAATLNPSRTTRRSAASLGDAVRSDLEMEQIIASLGNDDLTDPSHLALRNLAVVPDMISVVHGDIDYVFDDTNHLVHNPAEFYGPVTGIHDWTDEEKQIFLDKFAAYPKQFGLIAECLPNKTVSQCVDYYYLHKKTLINFRKVVLQMAPNKRRRGTRRDKQKGNGLLADIRQHDDEVHRGSGPSAFIGPMTRRKRVQMEGTPATTPTPEPETRQKRRRTNNAARLIPAEADEEPAQEQEQRPAKRGRKSRKQKQTVNATISEDTCGGGRPTEQNETTSRRKPAAASLQWSDEDRNLFLSLLSQYGDDFKRIAASMPNKTTIQVSNYYKTNLIDLDLGKVAAGAPKRSPTPELVREMHARYPGSGVLLPMTGGSSSSSVGHWAHRQDSHFVSNDSREAMWAAFLGTQLTMMPGVDVQNTSNVRSIIPDTSQTADPNTGLRPHSIHPGQLPRAEHPLIDDTACHPSTSPSYILPSSTASANTVPTLTQSHPSSPSCPTPTARGFLESKGEFSPRIRVYSYPQASPEHQPVLLPEYATFSGTS